MTNIYYLGNEILDIVFSFLVDDLPTVSAVMTTSKRWNNVMVCCLKKCHEEKINAIREHFIKNARVEIIPSAQCFTYCTTVRDGIKKQKECKQRIFTALHTFSQEEAVSESGLQSAHAQVIQSSSLKAIVQTIDDPHYFSILSSIRRIASFYLLAKKEEIAEENLDYLSRGIYEALCHNQFPLALSLFSKISAHPFALNEIKEDLRHTFAMAYVSHGNDAEAQNWLNTLHEQKIDGLMHCVQLCIKHNRSKDAEKFLDQLSRRDKKRVVEACIDYAARKGSLVDIDYFLTLMPSSSRRTITVFSKYALKMRQIALAWQGNSVQLAELLRAHHITKTDLWPRTTDIEAIQRFAQEFHVNPRKHIAQFYAPYVAKIGLLFEVFKLVDTLPKNIHAYALANCMQTHASQGNAMNVLAIFHKLSAAQQDTQDNTNPFTDEDKWKVLFASLSTMLESGYFKNNIQLITLFPPEWRLNFLRSSLPLCANLGMYAALVSMSALWKECSEKEEMLKACALILADKMYFSAALDLAKPWPETCETLLAKRHALLGF